MTGNSEAPLSFHTTVSDLVGVIASEVGEPYAWVNQLARQLLNSGFLPKSRGRRIATVDTSGVALLLYVTCAADRINDAVRIGQRCTNGETGPLSWPDFLRIVQDASDGVVIDLNDGAIHRWRDLADLHAATCMQRIALLPQTSLASLRAALLGKERS